jgi:hypothetical protein
MTASTLALIVLAAFVAGNVAALALLRGGHERSQPPSAPGASALSSSHKTSIERF